MPDSKTPSANPLFLREEELRQGIELLFFAYRDFTAEPDEMLAQYGFGRAHHRVIYFVGRNPRLPVSDLLAILKMGWISNFLSKAVITGFLFGAAIEVVVGELPKITGTSTPSAALRICAAHRVCIAVVASGPSRSLRCVQPRRPANSRWK